MTDKTRQILHRILKTFKMVAKKGKDESNAVMLNGYYATTT